MSTEVRISKPKDCDLCREESKHLAMSGVVDPEFRIERATVDGRMVSGQWANMCDDHWELYGVGRLGTGYGQRLIVEGE